MNSEHIHACTHSDAHTVHIFSHTHTLQTYTAWFPQGQASVPLKVVAIKNITPPSCHKHDEFVPPEQ